jgi:ribosomal protein L37AE/L43A
MATTEVVPAAAPERSAELQRFLPVMAMAQALERRNVIVEATQKLMRDGVDYGKIPGAGDRPCLLQPGADKLCNLFGLVIRYEFIEKIEDWSGAAHDGEPFFFYEIRALAYRGDFVMGEGVGVCHSFESKYRWRKSERVCPECGKPNIRKSRDGSGWYCWAKTGGCGATFRNGDKTIESQDVGRVANPDIHDQVNTILKMAYKRAKVSATINATSASEFFTQDVEDGQQNEPEQPQRTNGAAHRPAPPPDRTTEPVAEAKPHLSTLDQVLATFGKLATIQTAFAQLKPQFLQLLDINHWDQICIEHKCDGAKMFPSIGVAKKCFTALWEAARKASEELAAKEADPPVEDAAEAGREYSASNDDVPF